jgi:iron complex transport system ATP-binding protein
MPTRLAARKIQIAYAPHVPPVLAQFSLELASGTFLGIVGPNGSGKSTLIRALSRALKPAHGAVLLDEYDLYAGHSARSAARTIGVVPQETNVSLDFSVREVVRMGRAPHLPGRPFASESSDDERIVTEALRAARVEDLASRSVTTLSGGERQRVLFARALAQQPDVLLLDEPTASLDLRHQSEILTLARSLAHDGGKAVLAVLHDVNLAAAYCDALVLLNHGEIAAQGTPAEVLTAENLQAVYGARVWVRPHPISGRPLVLTLPELLEEDTLNAGKPSDRPQIHVICGGGTGAGLLTALHRLGFSVTAAGLNSGDTDAEAAQMLDIPFALESSFSPLSDATLETAASLAEYADVVVLTDVPFGQANLANLESALTLRRAGKTVLCRQSPLSDFSARDFTDGAALILWSALLAAGAVLLPTTEAVLSYLETALFNSPSP